MPSSMFQFLSDEDLGRILAFLETREPDTGLEREVRVGPLARLLLVREMYRPQAEEIDQDRRHPEETPRSDPLAHGSTWPGRTAPSATGWTWRAGADEDREIAPDVGLAAPSEHPDTGALEAIETSVWEAWMDRDGEALEAMTARRLAFVDIFGNATSGKAETIEFWTGHACDLQSARVVDGASTSLSPSIAMLTFRGILEGTCGGQEVPPIHTGPPSTRERATRGSWRSR